MQASLQKFVTSGAGGQELQADPHLSSSCRSLARATVMALMWLLLMAHIPSLPSNAIPLFLFTRDDSKFRYHRGYSTKGAVWTEAIRKLIVAHEGYVGPDHDAPEADFYATWRTDFHQKVCAIVLASPFPSVNQPSDVQTEAQTIIRDFWTKSPSKDS